MRPRDAPRRFWPNSRPEWLALVLLFGLVSITSTRADQFLLSRSGAVVRVVDLRAIPRTCPQAPGGWTVLTPFVARKPHRRCGAIWTDHGRLRVLTSGSLLPVAMTREEIVDALEAGACYEMRWFGYEEDPERGDPFDTSNLRSDNTVYYAARVGGDRCGPLPPSLTPRRALFWENTSDGLLLHLRVDVTGTDDAVLGVERIRDGRVLRLRIAPSPEGTDEALLTFLSERLRVPRAALRVVAGEGARRKTVLVEPS